MNGFELRSSHLGDSDGSLLPTPSPRFTSEAGCSSCESASPRRRSLVRYAFPDLQPLLSSHNTMNSSGLLICMHRIHVLAKSPFTSMSTYRLLCSVSCRRPQLQSLFSAVDIIKLVH